MIPKVKGIQQRKQTGSSSPEKKKSDTEAGTSTGKRGSPIQHRKSERIQASQSSSQPDTSQKIKQIKDAINRIPSPEDFSSDEMTGKTQCLEIEIKSDAFKAIHLKSQINYYLAAAYMNSCIEKKNKAEMYITKIAKVSHQTVENHIKTLNLYHTLSSSPLTEEKTAEIEELYQLVLTTAFPPAIFWFISCSLDPEKNRFFSPYSSLKLIEIAPTPFVMNNLTIIFSKNQNQLEGFERASLLKPEGNDREQVVSLITQSMLEKFVTTDRNPHITIPPQLFSILYAGLLTCRRSLRVGSIDQPGRAEHLASTLLTPDSKEKGIRIMEDYIPTLSPYLQGVTELIIGLIHKVDFILGEISQYAVPTIWRARLAEDAFRCCIKMPGNSIWGSGTSNKRSNVMTNYWKRLLCQAQHTKS